MLREQIVSIALSYIGQREIPGNKGFYDPEFEKRMRHIGGWQTGWAWCACFTKLVWKEAYARVEPRMLPDLSKMMQPGVMNTYREFKRLVPAAIKSTPTPGDLAVWRMFRNGKATGFGHIGIVSKVHDSTYFLCIEGNTNAAGSREGEAVAEKGRKMSDTNKTHGLRLLGFIQPI